VLAVPEDDADDDADDSRLRAKSDIRSSRRHLLAVGGRPDRAETGR
jgi:hypothetical protein